MKLVKPEGNGSDFKKVIAPAGVHIARVFRIIDLGTHYNAQFDKSNRQVEISWELPEELHTFKANTPHTAKSMHIPHTDRTPYIYICHI